MLRLLQLLSFSYNFFEHIYISRISNQGIIVYTHIRYALFTEYNLIDFYVYAVVWSPDEIFIYLFGFLFYCSSRDTYLLLSVPISGASSGQSSNSSHHIDIVFKFLRVSDIIILVKLFV